MTERRKQATRDLRNEDKKKLQSTPRHVKQRPRASNTDLDFSDGTTKVGAPERHTNSLNCSHHTEDVSNSL